MRTVKIDGTHLMGRAKKFSLMLLSVTLNTFSNISNKNGHSEFVLFSTTLFTLFNSRIVKQIFILDHSIGTYNMVTIFDVRNPILIFTQTILQRPKL